MKPCIAQSAVRCTDDFKRRAGPPNARQDTAPPKWEPEMNQERWKEIETKPLKSGAHASIEAGGCIMEMVSYLANEPWSDHPECACPILTEYAIRMNDRFTDEHRQLMKPLIPLLLNTKATDAVQIARKRLIRWRNVTATYPLILEAIKLPGLAAELRKFENNLESMALASKFLDSHNREIKKAGDAYAYADAYANANANANADANAYADAYAYAYANANAYAYANADAYANAKKQWQDQLADVAIETLRLAIAVQS